MTESLFASIELNQKFMKRIVLLLICLLVDSQTFGQSVEKKVTSYSQSWYSINSTLRFSDRWGMVGDFHLRLDDFMADEYFYFLRAGAMYWIAGKYPVVVGVAHLWQAPPDGKKSWSDESRIYEQWSAIHKEGIVSISNRIRFEQRWKDQIINDQVVGDKSFTLRLRYLASFDIKPFKNPRVPSFVVSDEACVQFGESIVFNTFDQNRFFLGVKESLSKKLSFDIGYMNIWQQKPAGNQYTTSHVFRLFFYYNADLRKNLHEPV
jgi:hypothetical protein